MAKEALGSFRISIFSEFSNRSRSHHHCKFALSLFWKLPRSSPPAQENSRPICRDTFEKYSRKLEVQDRKSFNFKRESCNPVNPKTIASLSPHRELIFFMTIVAWCSRRWRTNFDDAQKLIQKVFHEENVTLLEDSSLSRRAILKTDCVYAGNSGFE